MMAMDGLIAWILANGYTDEVGSGIASINPTSTGFELITTTGTTLSFTIPNMHIHSNLNNILEKFTLDSNGNLLFEGKMVINNPIVNDNKEFPILSSEWIQDSVDTEKYTWTKTHNLNTKSIDCTVYNNLDEEETVGIKTPDVNTVILTSLVPFDGRIVINYSTVLSSVSGSGSVSDGTVKMTVSDVTGQYLADLIDNSTVQNVSGKLVVKSLDGLVIGTTELNLLQGMTENVKAKFDSLSTAMRFTGTVSTKALLLAVGTMASGDVKIVLADETNSGKKITYIYDGTNWVSLGEFNVVIRDFSVTPLDLTSEVTGILPTTNLPTTLVQKSTTDTLTNKTLDATNNTISNLNTTNFASGIIDMDGTLSSNSDDKIASEKAVKTYSDTKIPKVSSPTANDIAIMNSDGTISDGGILKTDILTKTNTATVTNKTLVDSSTKLIDETDNTKVAQFECNGITTGNTRTLKIPDKDGTIALLNDIASITDNSSSGYMDLGMMRVQWGKNPSTASGEVSTTFPMPFANTSYCVTTSPIHATTTSVNSIIVRTKTTTSFTCYRCYESGASFGASNLPFDWIAIGIKG